MLHTLHATPETIHWGYFDASLKPVLKIRSGDFVALDAVTHQAGDAPELLMDDAIQNIYETIPLQDRHPGVHLMTGPIYVEEAEPGDTLEVRYLSLVPRLPFGTNIAANWGYLAEEFGHKERVTIFYLDRDRQVAVAKYAYDYPGSYEKPGQIINEGLIRKEVALEGFRIPLKPHIGTAGVALAQEGRVSTVPPGIHGGNIDNWRIGAGSAMYYPVQVPGALFSVGDPHVSQGDGELDGTAIEASLNAVMQISVRKHFRVPSPLLDTGSSWIVHGFDPDLNKAMRQASLAMLDFLANIQKMSRHDAYALMSVAADFTVTQVVDQRQGIHVAIPKNVFPPR